jgi:hypothetical protein
VKPHGDGLRYDLLPKPPHFAPKAKAMISLFMMGGPSQMDLFDPKPMLTKYDGQKFPGEIKYDNLAEASAKVFGSPWKFSPCGQCGMELSELLPHLGEIADDVTLIRSMHSGVNNHAQALYALNGGRALAGRPALGSWLTYGLGSETQELPAYMVLAHPSGLPTFQQEHFSTDGCHRSTRAHSFGPPSLTFSTSILLLPLREMASAGNSNSSVPLTKNTSRSTLANSISRRASLVMNSPQTCKPRQRKPSISRANPNTSEDVWRR